jgi:GR25 family glycosyltransferase involved in LPS biosynthesis
VSSGPPFRGVYINLERSKERQAYIDAQLRNLKLQEHYQRFAAIDGRKLQHYSSSHLARDEVAVLMSHVEALQSLIQYRKCGHILEDDTELTSYVAPVMTNLIETGIFDEFDIVFTDIIVVPVPEIVSLFKDILGDKPFVAPRGVSDFSIVNLKKINFAGSNSYFVGSHAIERVAEILHSEVRNDPTVPIDLCLSKNSRKGAIRAACIFPFLTSVDADLSANPEVEGRKKQATDKLLAVDLLRSLFFVDTHFDESLSGLLNRLVGKEMFCSSHQEYLDAILERLKNKPVMD